MAAGKPKAAAKATPEKAEKEVQSRDYRDSSYSVMETPAPHENVVLEHLGTVRG